MKLPPPSALPRCYGGEPIMAGSLASLLAGDMGDGLTSRAPMLRYAAQTHSPRPTPSPLTGICKKKRSRSFAVLRPPA
ncbi:hypothetical protein VZT92_000909 [Zoarces viviparus]|uniref:Uncharacterized protein n=1 Tax=Zoarces viviparus TaxID=48416 RepID=A0AAW1G8R7_ZOAVI